MPALTAAGAQRVSLELAEGLLDAGVDVDLVVGTDVGELRSEVPARARLFVLGRGRRVALCLPPLVAYLRSRRPRAVISCLDHMNILCIAAARFVRPRPWVMVTEHNTLSTSSRQSGDHRDHVMPHVMALAYRGADRIVAVSDGVADDLARTARLPRARIHTVYNPVRFERVAAAAASPVDHPWLAPEAGPVVLAVGRLVAQKDYPTLLHAFVRLPESFRLIILGDGPDRSALEKLVVDLGLAGKVDLHGFVDNPYPYFAAADVFALSSRWEGLPTVLIEALAFAAPIVATDCPSGPLEILEHGRWGRLVPVGDSAALADAIVDAAASPTPRPAGACDRYQLGTVTRRYLDLLPSSVTGPPPTSAVGPGEAGDGGPPPGRGGQPTGR
ncbi:MAG TPA: glycosyltransferase [Acidimicrobiales bacterium]|nr:glycosyltransferase [Acidimicrobiales bacterium]